MPIAGISNWYRPQAVADGDSISLYEHKPGSTQHHGDPIADVYSIILRPNNCVLAVADGVNWGIKPRLAARCAMHGFFDHLNSSLYSSNSAPQTTQDIFHSILRSFHSGQKLIIQHGGTTTTLCAGVVVELQEQKAGAKWGLCIVSVGDTLCYLWRDDVQMAYEITSAMHMGKERDPRDCGGCLGCDLGDQPDLSNLLCFFVPIADNDIVFIVSDGISDNFDPVILKDALAEGQPISPVAGEAPQISLPPQQPHPHGHADIKSDVPRPPGPSNGSSSQLPVLSPDQRQALCLMKLTNTLKQKLKSVGYSLDAHDVNDAIIDYVIEATEVKRAYLELCWVKLDKPDLTVAERRVNERKIAQHIKCLPGKLDHASIAAYKVGKVQLGVNLRAKCPTHSYMTKEEPKLLKKTRSVFDSSRTSSSKGHGEIGGVCAGKKTIMERGDGHHHEEVVKSHFIDCQCDGDETCLLPENPPLREAAMVNVADIPVDKKMQNGDGDDGSDLSVCVLESKPHLEDDAQ